MGSVIPLKKSANSAYLELKNMLGTKFLGCIPLNDEIKNFNFDSIDDSLFGIVDNVVNA